MLGDATGQAWITDLIKHWRNGRVGLTGCGFSGKSGSQKLSVDQRGIQAVIDEIREDRFGNLPSKPNGVRRLPLLQCRAPPRSGAALRRQFRTGASALRRRLYTMADHDAFLLRT
jgi:hypothetical protein